jgi:polyisoprenoid-binding protein YceI
MAGRLAAGTLASLVILAGIGVAVGLGPQELGTRQGKPAMQEESPKPAEHTKQDPKSTPAAALATWQVDPVHSSNVFKIRHSGVANFYGRFNQISGTIAWSKENPEAGSIAVEVKTDSIDTNNSGRDKHLKSGDFFDAEKYPTIAFKSTKIAKIDDHNFDVTGDLTMHGVTKPITVKFEHGGIVNNHGLRTGFETTFTAKRSDFGMSNYLDQGMIGDEVTMTVSLSCAPAKE